jgi:hypothetical protein
MLVDEAERGDEAVDGLPPRSPARMKGAVVARRLRGQLDAPGGEHCEPPQLLERPRSLPSVGMPCKISQRMGSVSPKRWRVSSRSSQAASAVECPARKSIQTLVSTITTTY